MGVAMADESWYHPGIKRGRVEMSEPRTCDRCAVSSEKSTIVCVRESNSKAKVKIYIICGECIAELNKRVNG